MGKEVMPSTHRYMKVHPVVKRGKKLGLFFFLMLDGEMLSICELSFFW